METLKKNNEFKIGNTVLVPIHMSTGTIEVLCAITDERASFGRPEIEVTPLEGKGSSWVSVARIIDGQGPAHRSKGWQETHNDSNRAPKAGKEV